MILVDVLVVSDKYDFTTDFVCIELEKREVNYLRLNRDEFHLYKIHLDTSKFDMRITISGRDYTLTKEKLKSIYYRAPIFLRGTEQSIEDQLYSEQWMAFVRNLIIFEEVTWINNPEKTYKAENKIVQLKYAKKIGFNIPHTIVTNTSPALSKDNYIVKSLDTAFFHIEEDEGFIYSNIFKKGDIQKANLEWAPVTIQDYISPKIDIRVTVIEDDVFATSITSNGRGVNEDWRKVKDDVEFKTIYLPKDIENKCIRLVKELELKFGAIDLLRTDDDNFIFLEVNPTGEWAWLVHKTGQTIPQSITDKLVNF
ncbi:RimK-like protein [Halobacillus trueperi]|uniref:RimK-like protein n=1 Tax=Halobacillus trueperi TaxID=156205 RepID=A0A3D8VN67_9BACI|nr:RimK-like protein [Halobacillus trueperi]RDY70854.1 RimK-like protein [Halobacillus trueperi]